MVVVAPVKRSRDSVDIKQFRKDNIFTIWMKRGQRRFYCLEGMVSGK